MFRFKLHIALRAVGFLLIYKHLYTVYLHCLPNHDLACGIDADLIRQGPEILVGLL